MHCIPRHCHTPQVNPKTNACPSHVQGAVLGMAIHHSPWPRAWVTHGLVLRRVAGRPACQLSLRRRTPASEAKCQLAPRDPCNAALAVRHCGTPLEVEISTYLHACMAGTKRRRLHAASILLRLARPCKACTTTLVPALQTWVPRCLQAGRSCRCVSANEGTTTFPAAYGGLGSKN